MQPKLLLFVVLYFIPVCIFSQDAKQEEEEDGKVFHKRYFIKKGQKLYTKDSKSMEGLKAYSKKTVKNINGQTVTEIETGDYERIEITTDGVVKKENGDFTVYKKTLTGNGDEQEVKFEIEKKEFEKENKIALDIEIEYGEKTIKVKLKKGIKPEAGKIASFKNSEKIVNSADKGTEFYWKLEAGEEFKYYRRAFVLGAVSLPFKLRFGKESEERPATVETGLENVGVYIGRRFSSIGYRNSSFTYLHTTFGFFAGPQKITINKDNSKGIVTEEISRLGVTTGFLLSFSAGNLNLGIAPGIDILGGKHKDDWVYNKKLWIGFAVGYKISIL